MTLLRVILGVTGRISIFGVKRQAVANIRAKAINSISS
jgi:hypothetical protein